MNVPILLGATKDAATQWITDKAPAMGAALAYYSIFSLAPLLVILIGAADLIFGEEVSQAQITLQLEELIGREGGEAIEAMVKNARESQGGGLATTLGVVMLFVGATGVFGQLQDSLNTIWKVQPKPGRGFWGFLQDRFLSIAMVMGVAFLLLVSLVVSTGLTAVNAQFRDWQTTIVSQCITNSLDIVVISTLFASIYKFIPDAEVAWRDVWVGAIITALLFTFGKFLIGQYLGRAAIGSAYGAAGSLAVLLVWLYYASQIFLFGAELTKAYATRHQYRIRPKENAVTVSDVARLQQGLSSAK